MLSEQSCPIRMMLPHVVGRGVTWWGESSPQKSLCDSSSEGGSASCRHEKRQEELPGHVVAAAVTRWSFPGFSTFPVEADRMSRRGSQTMKMVWQGLTRFCVPS